MALAVKDRVRETSATAGTGTLTLAGAVTGFQAFSVIGNANTTYYGIVDATTGDWEVGIGTYTLSGTTLSRTTVLSSSNASSLVNFAANSKDVFVTYPSSKSVYLDASGGVTLAGTLGVTGATTLSTTLGVTGATTLSSTLAVTGATTLSTTLGVTGATTLSSTLAVTGATTLSTTLGVTGATTLSSTLAVTGATTLSTTLGVTGATTLSSTLAVTGATTLSTTLGVTGATTLSSTLAVTGITTVAAGTAALPSIVSTTGTADTGQWFPAADTIAWSTAGSERIRIGSTGLVSIGTTSSTYKLYVQSSVVAGSSGFTFTPQIVTEANATGGIGMQTPTANQAVISHSTPLDQNSTAIHFVGTGRYMSFHTVNDAERMRITSSGDVLIGTTATLGATARMEIVGQPDLLSLRYSSATAATYVRFICNANNDFYISNADFTQYVYKDYAGNTWGSSSDERLKDIIEPITDGLNKVLKLRSVIGKFKTDKDDKRRSFLIAQDVLEVLPEAVQLTNNHVANREEYVLYYSDVIPLLVSAIKDLKTITEAQAIRIKAMETL